MILEPILFGVARLLIGLLQSLPLHVVARMGRAGGALAYLIDARHRKVAQQNLALAFPEKSVGEVRALTKENFKRIGENFSCAVRTANMDAHEIQKIVTASGEEKLRAKISAAQPQSIVVAIGHFGNFELFAHCGQFVKEYKFATTYRGLRQPSLNRLLQNLREKSGCLFFERRTDGEALKQAMNAGGVMLGLLSDQRAGNGVLIPFLGRDCSTSPAPAVLALRYHAPLFTAFCFRTQLGQWKIELADEIATHENGGARSSEAIMRDVNRSFENAIRRDPANWFWVHNRWRLSDEQAQKISRRQKRAEANIPK